MTRKTADWIGLAAALYVIATFRRRVAATIADVTAILREVWNDEALERQLYTPQLMLNEITSAQIAFKHDMRRSLFVSRSRSLPGGWGERYRNRKARRARRRRDRVRAAWRAVTLTPPTR